MIKNIVLLCLAVFAVQSTANVIKIKSRNTDSIGDIFESLNSIQYSTKDITRKINQISIPNNPKILARAFDEINRASERKDVGQCVVEAIPKIKDLIDKEDEGLGKCRDDAKSKIDILVKAEEDIETSVGEMMKGAKDELDKCAQDASTATQCVQKSLDNLSKQANKIYGDIVHLFQQAAQIYFTIAQGLQICLAGIKDDFVTEVAKIVKEVLDCSSS